MKIVLVVNEGNFTKHKCANGEHTCRILKQKDWKGKEKSRTVHTIAFTLRTTHRAAQVCSTGSKTFSSP